ncbi:unnamed protein product, partial [Mesorhabditis spiculigera]
MYLSSGYTIFVFLNATALQEEEFPAWVYFCYAFNTILLTVALFTFPIACYTLRSVMMIHQNLLILFGASIIGIYVYYVAYIIIILYGFQLIPGYEFGSNDLPPPLIAASYSRIFVVICFGGALFTMPAERFLASYWMDRYEEKRWTLIPVLLILIQFVSAAIGAAVLTFNLIPITLTACLVVPIIFSVALLDQWVLSWNRNAEKQMQENRHYTYTLSRRYQVQENIVMLKVLRRCIWWIVVQNSGMTALFIAFLELTTSPQIRNVIGTLLEVYTALCISSTTIVVFLADRIWWQAYKKSWRRIWGRICGTPEVEVEESREASTTTGKDIFLVYSTSEYFQHLRDHWEAGAPKLEDDSRKSSIFLKTKHRINSVYFLKSAADPQCPAGLYYDTFGACLMLNQDLDTFTKAQDVCTKVYHGQLASIHNAYQNAILSSMARNYNVAGYVIIGLVEKSDKTWCWTDNSTIEFLKWGKAEPYDCDGCGQAYLSADDGNWYSMDGDEHHLPSFCLVPALNTTGAPPTLCTGTWGDWYDTSYCSETCGGCGWKTQQRECQPDICLCDGPATQIAACPEMICEFPENACCPFHQKFLNRTDKHYECAWDQEPVMTTVAPPCHGAWSGWKSMNNCTDTCGMCGWERMERACEPAGCQCVGSPYELQPCAEAPCTDGRGPCCHGYAEQPNPSQPGYYCAKVDDDNDGAEAQVLQ